MLSSIGAVYILFIVVRFVLGISARPSRGAEACGVRFLFCYLLAVDDVDALGQTLEGCDGVGVAAHEGAADGVDVYRLAGAVDGFASGDAGGLTIDDDGVFLGAGGGVEVGAERRDGRLVGGCGKGGTVGV
jgi:hypothetical protein